MTLTATEKTRKRRRVVCATTIELPPDVRHLLGLLARKQGTSVANLARRFITVGLRKYLERNDQMPWEPRDAYAHTKKASSPHLQRMWSRIANERLSAGDDEASAIRQANAAVANAKPTARKKSQAPSEPSPTVPTKPLIGQED